VTTSITSFDGHAINDGTVYAAFFRIDDRVKRRTVGTSILTPAGKHPALTATTRTEALLPVRIQILSGTLQDKQDELDKWLRPGTTGDLIASFGGVSRKVSCAVQEVIPYDGSPNLYTAILIAPDARWLSAATTSDTFATSTTATNDGNIPATDAIITVKPKTAKLAADDWLYRRQVVVANRTGNAFVDWAIELTGGGWDHKAEVTALRSQADGDDVRVIIDGEDSPRWPGESGTVQFDQVNTILWANVTLSPGYGSELLTAMASASVPAVGSQIEFPSGTLADWPASGTMLIDDEAVGYSTATLGDSKDTVIVTERGARNTTAAAHSAAAAVWWVERDITIIFGHTTIGAPDDQDHRKPMINVTTSTNDEHQWLEFAHDTDPRSMQWSRVQRTRDSQSDLIISGGGEPVTDATMEYAIGGPVAGKPSFNGWAMRVPSGTRYGSGNHAMSTTGMTVADTLFANWFGIDGDGNEANVLNSGLGNIGTSGTHLSDEPAAPLYALEMSARNAVVTNSPDGTEDISPGSGAIAAGEQLTQSFDVPDTVGRFAYIDAIAVKVKVNTGGVILDVVIAQDDGTGTFVYLTPGQSYTVTSGTYVWALVTLAERRSPT